ncbi:GATA transcription factor 18-like isoform X1 [Capsicum chacoense]
MMHRCSGSMGGPCSCGLFHSQTGTTTTSSSPCSSLITTLHLIMNIQKTCTRSFAPSSSSVDCTLSLGTPSTRLTNLDSEKKLVYSNDQRRSSSKCMSNFWDILHPKQHMTTPSSAHKSTRGGSSGNDNSTNDPLVARR